MSHNHYLSCRACGVTSEAENEQHGSNTWTSSFSKFPGGTELVENALAVRALVEAGVDFGMPTIAWAPFVAQHAACNAFYEICGNDPDRECGDAPRRILVKGAHDTLCKSCHGRRLVSCPECSGGAPGLLAEIRVWLDTEIGDEEYYSGGARQYRLKTLREVRDAIAGLGEKVASGA